MVGQKVSYSTSVPSSHCGVVTLDKKLSTLSLPTQGCKWELYLQTIRESLRLKYCTEGNLAMGYIMSHLGRS